MKENGELGETTVVPHAQVTHKYFRHNDVLCTHHHGRLSNWKDLMMIDTDCESICNPNYYMIAATAGTIYFLQHYDICID